MNAKQKMMLATIGVLLLLGATTGAVAGDNDKDKYLDVGVEICESTGLAHPLLELKDDSGFKQISRDEDATLLIRNRSKCKVTITGKNMTIEVKDGDDLTKKLGDLQDVNGTVNLSASKDNKTFGLDIVVIQDTAVEEADCPEKSRFNAVHSRLGTLWTLEDGELGGSSTMLQISGISGFKRRPADQRQGCAASSPGQLQDKRLAMLAEEKSMAVPSPAFVEWATDPQLAEYRLLGYANVTAIKMPSPAEDNGDENGDENGGKQANLTEEWQNAEMSVDAELGLMLRLDAKFLRIDNPDTAILLRAGIGGSTYEPKANPEAEEGDDDYGDLVAGHSPFFWNLFLRFESNYESWGPGNKMRGFLEVGYREYKPFGSDEKKRLILSTGLSLPVLQAGNRAALFPFLQLDFPLGDGEMTNHRVGVLADVNLDKLFTSGS